MMALLLSSIHQIGSHHVVAQADLDLTHEREFIVMLLHSNAQGAGITILSYQAWLVFVMHLCMCV